MPTRIDLPGGHHAEVRGEEELLDEDVEAMMGLMQADDGPGTMVLKMARALAVQMTKEWTLVNGDGVTPLPVTAEAFRKLPWSVSRPIRTAVAPMVQQIMAEMNPDADPKSEAPSLPSATTD